MLRRTLLLLTASMAMFAANSVHEFTMTSIDGKPAPLSAYKGKVVMFVNVASKCGYTPQYEGLEKLQREMKGKGFNVLGFPSNDFGAQEPDTPEQIRKFCESKYQITFPLFAKVRTKSGEGQSPVYTALEKASGKLPSWNFGKYLIGRDGRVIDYFTPPTDPEDEKLTQAIEKALTAPPAG